MVKKYDLGLINPPNPKTEFLSIEYNTYLFQSTSECSLYCCIKRIITALSQ